MSLAINFLTGAARVPAPALSDPPASGAGHFGDLLSDLWERETAAGGFLGDESRSAGDEGQAAGKSVADVFNQHGLLARDETTDATAVALASAAAMPVADPTSQPDANVTGASYAGGNVVVSDTAAPSPVPPASTVIVPSDAALASAQTTRDSDARSGQASPGIAGSTAGDVAPHFPTPPLLASVRAAMPATSLVAPADALMQEAAATVEDGQVDEVQLPRRDAAQGAASDAQVTLGMSDGRVAVAVRAIDGVPAERVRLRERIAALLARYGLRAGDVRLNGTLLASAADPRGEEL